MLHQLIDLSRIYDEINKNLVPRISDSRTRLWPVKWRRIATSWWTRAERTRKETNSVECSEYFIKIRKMNALFCDSLEVQFSQDRMFNKTLLDVWWWWSTASPPQVHPNRDSREWNPPFRGVNCAGPTHFLSLPWPLCCVNLCTALVRVQWNRMAVFS